MRSDRLPQAMLPTAIARKPMVMAVETPVIDQPVSRAMGLRNTGSENIAPTAMQPKKGRLPRQSPPAIAIIEDHDAAASFRAWMSILVIFMTAAMTLSALGPVKVSARPA